MLDNKNDFNKQLTDDELDSATGGIFEGQYRDGKLIVTPFYSCQYYENASWFNVKSCSTCMWAHNEGRGIVVCNNPSNSK